MAGKRKSNENQPDLPIDGPVPPRQEASAQSAKAEKGQEAATVAAWKDADPGEFDLVEGTTSGELKTDGYIDSLRMHANKCIGA